MKNKNEAEKEVADLLLWHNKDAYKLMEKTAAEYGIAMAAITELVAWERAQQERSRRRGRTEAFDEIFENPTYWK